MVPFASAFELSTNNSSQTPFFIPYHCLNGFGTNDQEFMRHANMYTQYRIKCIRFEYVPTTACAKGTTLPMTSVYPPSITTTDVRAAMDANQINSSTLWLIKWPNKKTGLFQDFGVNFNNTLTNRLSNQRALNDPNVIKIPVTEKLVLSWKPRILGYKPVMFRTLNSLTSASEKAQDNFLPSSKSFPWMNIIDNVEAFVGNPNEVVGVNPVNGTTGGFTGPYNTTGLRVQMSQPQIAMYNTVYNTFVTPADFESTGRWYMHTVFEFRRKRDQYAEITSTMIHESILNYPEMEGVNPVNTFDRV